MSHFTDPHNGYCLPPHGTLDEAALPAELSAEILARRAAQQSSVVQS